MNLNPAVNCHRQRRMRCAGVGSQKMRRFCDGAHAIHKFRGDETASKENYLDRARIYEGTGMNFLDDDRCAFARFCHRDKGNAWELAEESFNEDSKAEAIRRGVWLPRWALDRQ